MSSVNFFIIKYIRTCVITFGLLQPSVTPQSILLGAATQHGQVLDAALHIRM